MNVKWSDDDDVHDDDDVDDNLNDGSCVDVCMEIRENEAEVEKLPKPSDKKKERV